MRVVHHKLVRDQIPAIITADGGQPVTRVLDDAGYEAALRAKLLEEAHEAQAAPDGQLASEPTRYGLSRSEPVMNSAAAAAIFSGSRASCRSARGRTSSCRDRAAGSRAASVVQQMSEPTAEPGLIQPWALLPCSGLLALGGALGGISPPSRG